jgi:integrase
MEILIAVARRAQIPAADGLTMRLEQKQIDDITKADIEAVRRWRRQEQAAGKSRPGSKGGSVGINRLLSRIRHLFSWAVIEGKMEQTPFKRAGVTILKLEPGVEGHRTRRLDMAGQTAVLRHASSLLRAVLVAALTTGCRVGELLQLRWKDIRLDAKGDFGSLVIRAEINKTATSRIIPIGTRLRAELAMRQHGADGKKPDPNAFVFGNEVGEQTKSVRRQWEDAVLSAYGHTPCRKRGKLTPASQAAFREIDLHIHDLRREFGSSLLESGADVHDVSAFLGHANITTTSRYLQSTPARMEQALSRMEQRAGFAHHSHKEASESPSGHSETEDENPANLLN